MNMFTKKSRPIRNLGLTGFLRIRRFITDESISIKFSTRDLFESPIGSGVLGRWGAKFGLSH